MTTILVKRKPYWVPVDDGDPPATDKRPAFEIKALKEIPALLAA